MHGEVLRPPAGPRPLPLAARLLLTAFVLVLVPAYAREYGVRHFLWLSDVALLLTLVAVWRTSPLVNGMLVLGPLPFELVWNLDFVLRLLGLSPTDFTAYMLDDELTVFLRALSLFHVALPVLWIWMLVRWGHPRGALAAAVLAHAAVVLGTWALTDPARNVNFVFAPAAHGWDVPQPLWVALVIAVPLLAVSWPLHRLLRRWCPLRGG